MSHFGHILFTCVTSVYTCNWSNHFFSLFFFILLVLFRTGATLGQMHRTGNYLYRKCRPILPGYKEDKSYSIALVFISKGGC